VLTRNVSSNNSNGIFLNSVSGTSVSENIVDSNTHTGIEVLFSINNAIFNNNLLDNSTQASDLAGGGNVFYQFPPVGGNYWSDLAGCPDGNSDGFCDIPHVFLANFDLFPLTDPVSIGDTTPPTLVLPPSAVLDAASPDGALHIYSVSATDDQDPAPVVVCSPAQGSVFPLGTTTVNCTATDASGNTSSGSFDVRVYYLALDYAVLGTHSSSAVVGTKSTVTNGIVGGKGKVTLKSHGTVGNIIAAGNVTVGTKSVAGSLTVDGKVTIKTYATTGDITASGSVKVGRKATTGTITEDAAVDLPNITLPTVNASPDTGNDIIRRQKDARNGAIELSPGSCGQLLSASKDTINLVGGEYHFEKVVIKAGSAVMVDLTNGQPLVVQVVGNLSLGTKVRMEIVGGDASDVIVLVGGRKATLGSAGTFVGTFIAPNGKVVLGTKATLTGAAWGSKVTTRAQSSVSGVSYDHELP
jgi:parallel beta-helix repeat protein